MRPEPSKILFLAPPVEDYLALGLLHGLRGLFGDRVIDFPRFDVAYRDFPAERRSGVYGRGFSAFFGLPEVGVDRTRIEERAAAGEFDLIVFSDIWRQDRLFARWRPRLRPETTVIVDGHDSANVYPHAGLWWRNPRAWRLPRANTGFLYFKREWAEDTQFNLWHRVVPRGLRRRLPAYRGLRETSFSFIESKIASAPPAKTKDFPRHIVDAEVAATVPGSATKYAFDSEADYYADLQSARFGITTRRSGWDCMRHYEIAGNGAVPCFRDLESKPATCAPHGLVPGENCLSYRSAAELTHAVAQIDPARYAQLQAGALAWVRSKTTVAVARALVDAWRAGAASGR
jgi:hypothetical protein